jgi:O-6-methylguanine DNA methyltransferase
MPPPDPDATWALPTAFGSDLRLVRTSEGVADTSFVPEATDVHPAPPDRIREPLEAYLEDPPSGLPVLPLDLSAGSAFQRDVWEALQAIPAGETRTYGEVAASAGHGGAAQAAGQAVGANPVVLLVPCHRVVPAGGGVGGYSARGGPSMKRRILAAEGAHPDPSGG